MRNFGRPRLGFCIAIGFFLSTLGTNALAQTNSEQSELSVLLRLQPEFVYVGGGAAKARGTDGFQITDGWAGGNKNSANWGGLFADGSHSITSDTEVFAHISLNIDMDGLKDGPSRDREMYVGIRSPLGELRAGRLETPYKKSAIGWDPLNGTFMQSRGNIGRSGGAFGHGGFFDRSLSYSKNIGSAKFSGMVSLDQESVSDLTGDNDHLVSASLSLPAGPFELIGAYIDGSEYQGGANRREAVKLGAQLRRNDWSFAVNYEARGFGLENGDFIFVSGSYRLKQWQWMANAGLFSDDDDLNNGSYFALGARYQLHNLVSVHGGLRYLDRDITGRETIAGIGLRIMLRSGNLVQ